MKNIIIAIAVVLVIAGAITYRTLSSTSSPGQQVASTVQLASDTKIYDVRTIDEYNTSHVKTAALFPLTDMQAGKFPDIPKDTPIALYCHSGNRAGQALTLMKQAGFTNVRSLGGLTDLAKYGLKAE